MKPHLKNVAHSETLHLSAKVASGFRPRHPIDLASTAWPHDSYLMNAGLKFEP